VEDQEKDLQGELKIPCSMSFLRILLKTCSVVVLLVDREEYQEMLLEWIA